MLDAMDSNMSLLDLTTSDQDLTTGIWSDVIQVSSSSSSGKTLTRNVRMYALIIAEILGIILNFVTLYVFFKTPLRQTGLYLFALAIADNIALVAELIRWFSSSVYLGLEWMDQSLVLCKVTNHMRYGARLWSAFTTMTITFERYLAVVHPFKAAVLLRRKSTKIIILVEFVISTLMSLYASILFEIVPASSGHPGCSIYEANSVVYGNCNWFISKAVGEVVSSLVVLFFTILIIQALINARVFRQQNASESDPQKSSIDYQLTLMLVLVAIVFFIFRAPYTVSYYISHNRLKIFSGSPEYLKLVKAKIRNALDITFVFYTANHSVNFFLYCFSGTKFRSYLAMAFGKITTKSANTSVLSLSNAKGDKSHPEKNGSFVKDKEKTAV